MTLILDTETTHKDEGLTLPRLCSLVITDELGLVKFQSLIKPDIPIPAEATAVHGISNEMVKDAPTFANVAEEVLDLLRGQCVVAWNAAFDMRVLLYAFHLAGIAMPQGIEFCCAMLHYGELFGAKREDGQYRWHKLTTAYEMQFGAIGGLIESAHDALADCRMTAALWNAMSEPETLVTCDKPVTIAFTHVQRKLTRKGDAYASFTTVGGITLNIFDRQFKAVNAFGADLPAWIDALKHQAPDYVHKLKQPLRLPVDFRGEYPELYLPTNS